MKPKNLIIGVIVFLILANLYWGWYMYPIWYPQNVNIPNHQEVKNFCQAKGYETGWLDDLSCGANEVRCKMKYYDCDKYQCIKWVDKE